MVWNTRRRALFHHEDQVNSVTELCLTQRACPDGQGVNSEIGRRLIQPFEVGTDPLQFIEYGSKHLLSRG